MTTPPLIFGPVPPYSNPPIEPQNFQPSRFVISAIALGQTTTVTTTANVNYVIGQLVRLLIPQSFGSRQLNEMQGFVISIPAPNQIVISIDSSRLVDAFVNSSAPTKAQVIAIGDINTGLISSTGRTLPETDIPGSFINIS